MFDRFHKSFPADHRLAATEATRQAWRRLVSIDKAIGTLRTTTSASARVARSTASAIAKAIRSPSTAKPGDNSTVQAAATDQFTPHERDPIRSKHEWAGPAAMVIGLTSGDLRAGQPWHRRVLRSDRVLGFPKGWLRITPNDFLWSPTPTRSAGTAEVVQFEANSLADVELVAIGRRRAGLTITTRSGTEIWLLIDNRRKVDEMLRRFRYRDRS